MIFCSGGVWAAPKDKIEDEIPVFREVAPGIYRGAQPSAHGYDYLQSLGVKTIVNFRHEQDPIKWDEKQAKEREMQYVSLPWTIYGEYDRNLVKDYFEVMKDPANRPVFIHCRRGCERTSAMAALYYLKFEGLSDEEAFKKATAGIPIRWFFMPLVKKQYNVFKEEVKKSS